MITLTSQRYTIAPTGSTLDSRYPDGDVPLVAPSWSVESGLLVADVGTGSGEISIRWDRPTTNADASALRDLKTFRLYVGESTGSYAAVNGVDLSTVNQPGATHVKVSGLSVGRTYYATVKAIDSYGNESTAATEQSFVAAAAESDPTSWTDISSLPHTISSNGNYRLTADLAQASGNAITITATGAVNVYGNGHALTLASAGAAVGIYTTAAPSALRIWGFAFVHSAGSTYVCRPIQLNADQISNSVRVHGNTWTGICNAVANYESAMVCGGDSSANTRDFAGVKVYANTVTLDGGIAEDCGIISLCKNARVYGNAVTLQNFRDGAQYSGVIPRSANEGCESWGNTFTIDNCAQASYAQDYSGGATAVNCYHHDNVVTVAATQETGHRVFHTDGGTGVVWLWNTINWLYSDPANSNRGFSVRGPASNVLAGYNTSNCNGNSAQALRYGGTAATEFPGNCYFYCNTSTQATRQGIEMSSDSAGRLSAWGNNFTNTSGYSIGGTNAGTASGDFNSNTITNPGTKVQGWAAAYLADWKVYDSWVSGDSTNNDCITYAGSWQGFNPASDTPAAPANLRAI